VAEYGTARQATDENMAHAICKLVTKDTNTQSKHVILFYDM